MNSIIVVTDSTASFPGLPVEEFAAGTVIQPWSKYYWPMLWAGNATDSGMPAEPQGDQTDAEYTVVAIKDDILADGDVVQYDEESGTWRGAPSALRGPEFGHPLGPFYAALARRNTTPAKAVFLGSSTTANAGASVPEKGWVGCFNGRMQAAYPSSTGTETPVRPISDATSSPSSAPGVQFINGGIAGATSATYCTSLTLYGIGIINPDVVFHMIGSNDSVLGATYVSPNNYRSNVNKAIDDIDALSASGTPVCHVLVHAFRRFGVTESVWNEYREVLLRIANKRRNVMFVDISAPFEGVRHISPDPYDVIAPDITHPTDTGHAVIADLVAKGMRLGLALPTDFTDWRSAAETTILGYTQRAEAAAAQAAPFLPQSKTSVVTAAVVQLADVNEWTVPNPVQITLPGSPLNVQYTVYVKSGFQNITWPNGTEVFGGSGAASTWLTLIRRDAGWQVLIASGGSSGGGGGNDFSVTNLFPNPALISASSHIVINSAGGPNNPESPPAGLVTYTGPGGCLRITGSPSAANYRVNIRMPNLTAGKQYEVRLSYLVAGVPAVTTVSGGTFGSIRTYTPPSSNSDLVLGFNPQQLLTQAALPANAGKWMRLFPVRFTAPTAPTEVWLTLPCGQYDISFKDVLVTEVTGSDAAIRDSFIPGVTPGATWNGVANNSQSTLSVLRSSDISWISQWKTARFTSPASAITDPEFMQSLSYPAGSTVVSTAVATMNENYTRVPGPPSWRGVHDGTPGSLMYGYRFGATEFLQNGAWATPTDWEISQAAGVSFGEIACTYRSGVAFWKFVNVSAKVANPTSPIIIINDRERPLQDVYEPVITSVGTFVMLKVVAATGAVSIVGNLPLGASLGIPGSSTTLAAAMVSWAVK